MSGFRGSVAGGGLFLPAGSQRALVESAGNWAGFYGCLFDRTESPPAPEDGATGAGRILQAYLRWGDRLAERLAGEFVFAVWDAAKKRLLLGRDSTGYRTLYYALWNGELRFATDPKLFFEWPDMSCQADEAHLAHWLALLPGPEDSTFFRGIRRLPPGHTLAFEDGRIRISRFFDPEKVSELRLRDSREYAEGLLDVLNKATSDRVDAAGEIAVQLSGGLDSTSVTALAASHLARQGRRLAAFTSVPATPQQFPGRFCDERTHAASVARMYPNVDHVLIPTGAHSMFQVADVLATGGLAPVRNLSHCAWLYEICRQAKLKRADTILAAAFGNLTISYDGAPALASSLASGRFAVAARLARDLHQHSGASWKSVLNRAVQPFLPLPVAGMIARIRSRNAPASPASFLRPEFARAYDVDAAATARPTHTRDSRLLRARFLYRFDTGIPSEAFWQATGVRRTDPTFDPRVVEFCLSVPLERFCEGGVGRSLIRDAMKGKIPEMVRTETRRGLQSADFLVNLRAEMPELRRELMRARSSGLVSRALNLPLMDEMGGWSEDRIRNFGWTVYASTMMRAVSAARFLRRMEDGTLFVMPPAPGGMPEASASAA